MKMKGFIHIVEIVIITLVMFMVVLQFATIPRVRSNWDRTKLMLLGNDLLFSGEKKGIDWFNENDIDYYMNKSLAKNIIYDVKIKNETGTYFITNNQVDRPVTASIFKVLNGNDFQVVEVILELNYFY